ncbi:hypothetical protein K9B33_19520 [Sphingobium sp. 3R8]|uniref:hypothetical protein n=1 Tax=Sphingobium sp. 3R8 TaxID=2874921 RepID=UPI001CCF0322|nr:hypothetical protein [Sphingobium sp. 3R8]MBZ9649731.1 hypothetical protein [Sphingobium sp. 3R8]
MPDDDFELWLGRIGAKDRSVGQTLARARRAGGMASAKGRRFTGAAIGRGAGVGRVLGASQRMSGLRARRVVVKARIVKLGGKGMAAAAHLRYLQRDGTTREGERGALYGADVDRVDEKAFLARGQGDRHQFRFIVAPEDGAEYEDLKPLVRRLMSQAKKIWAQGSTGSRSITSTPAIPIAMSCCAAWTSGARIWSSPATI